MPHTTPTATPDLGRRLRRLAWLVRGLALLGGLTIAALPLWLLLSPTPVLALYGPELLGLHQGDWTGAARARMAAVTAVPVAVALAALWQLWRLFGAYLQGDVFGHRPVAHLRRFGWAMAALALAEPLSRTLASVAISLDNPPGHRVLMLTLGSYDYALLMSSLVFVAIGHVMGEAARLADENAQFV